MRHIGSRIGTPWQLVFEEFWDPWRSKRSTYPCRYPSRPCRCELVSFAHVRHRTRSTDPVTSRNRRFCNRRMGRLSDARPTVLPDRCQSVPGNGSPASRSVTPSLRSDLATGSDVTRHRDPSWWPSHFGGRDPEWSRRPSPGVGRCRRGTTGGHRPPMSSHRRDEIDPASVANDDLGRRSTSELFALYRAILRELRGRGVVRTENAPAGDYAEFLVATALGGVLAPNSEKSYDVMADGVRLQVKARVVSDPPRSGQLQLSTFRSFDFDEAVIVLLDDHDYGVRQAVRVPVEELRAVAVRDGHVNGYRVHARPALMSSPRAVDISTLLRKVT